MELTESILDELAEHYTAQAIPPCQICGAELAVASMGGGAATVYACSVAMHDFSIPGDHYQRSKFVQHRAGDSRVLALIDEIRQLRS